MSLPSPNDLVSPIGLDTETDRNIPFIATITDSKLNSYLFDLSKGSDFDALENICASPDLQKIIHPFTYDSFCLSNVGIEVKPPYECTLAAANILCEQYASRKLKVMARQLLGEECAEERELSKVKAKFKREAKKKGILFSYKQIPAETLYPYAKRDPEYALKLWYLFEKPLKKYYQLYEIEKQVMPIVLKMQKRGFLIDREFVKNKIKYCEDNMRGIELWFHKYLRRHGYGIIGSMEFNPGSTAQVSSLLEKLHVPIKGQTKRGDLSTDADTLEPYRKKWKVVDQLLNYRFYGKQNSTYYSPLYNEYTTEDDPIAHFLLYQSGAKTGRFSAELIQTIPKDEGEKEHPKEIRKAFKPRPGYRLVSMDQDQVEMRIFAHVSKSKLLIEAIKKGLDPHLDTAYNLWGKNTVNKNPKKYRRGAKTINFGIIYGMGKDKLARTLGIPYAEATEILESYYDQYPVREFMQSEISKLYKRGSVHISYNSPLMKFSREYRVPTHLAYKAVNIIIQGTCAYITKCSMIRADELIGENEWDVHMLLTLHDETIFEMPDDERTDEIYIPKLKEVLEDKVTFRTPVTVGIKESIKSWGDMKEITV